VSAGIRQLSGENNEKCSDEQTCLSDSLIFSIYTGNVLSFIDKSEANENIFHNQFSKSCNCNNIAHKEKTME
jgi:hypothetical protein